MTTSNRVVIGMAFVAFISVLVASLSLGLVERPSLKAQSTVTPDPQFNICAQVNYVDGTFSHRVEVFQAVEDGRIYTWEYDAPTRVAVERLATPKETACFNQSNDASQLAIDDSRTRISGIATQLKACIDEIDALTLQGCVALNSQILMDLLILNGNIPPSSVVSSAR